MVVFRKRIKVQSHKCFETRQLRTGSVLCQSPLKENLCFGAVLAGGQTYLAYFHLSRNTTRQTSDDLNILQSIHKYGTTFFINDLNSSFQRNTYFKDIPMYLQRCT